jgi:hypothetical protein
MDSARHARMSADCRNPEFPIMRRIALVSLVAASACAQPHGPVPTPAEEPVIAAAPEPSAPRTPARGDGPMLPEADAVLTRIVVACCPDPDADMPVLAAVAAVRPELMVFVDWTGAAPVRAEAYGRLNLNAQFAALNMAVPMLAAPGPPLSDAEAEADFESYWTGAAPGAGRDGVHGSRIFGLPGRRVQVVITSPNPDRDQEAWLDAELRRPAEVRVLVGSASRTDSSVQGALVRIPTGSEPTGEELASLSPPPVSGPEAGFGLIEVDWPRRRVFLSRYGRAGQQLERRVIALKPPPSGSAEPLKALRPY